MNKAVIYARYSSHNQREESIEGQIRECKAFAEKHDYVIVGEYIDRAISGKTDNRAEFQRMMHDCEKQRFDAVIVYDIDRFARNRYDSAIHKAKLKKNGIRVHYAKTDIPDSPEGIILESVMEGYAEYYSENLSVHVKRGMNENALKCQSNGGTIPLGYTISSDKKFTIVPSEAKIVRDVFQMYADGKSCAQICKYCNEQGYRTKRGAKFNKNSLRCILKNEKYIGVYKFHDVRVENGIPQIVDKDLFDKVQVLYKRNFTARARSKARVDYLLSGKLYCGHCGNPMVADSGTSCNGEMYHYYKCSNRKQRHQCDKKAERKEWLEQIVVQHTVQYVLTDSNIDAIATKAAALMEKEANDDSLISALEQDKKDVERRLKNIVDMMEQGIVTTTTKDRLLELESLKVDLEKRIAQESVKKPSLTKDHIVFWLESFRKGDVSDVNYQRKIIDTLVNSIYLYDSDDGGKEIVFTFNLSSSSKSKIKCSDIDCYARPNRANPNKFFFFKEYFGFAETIRV